MNENDAKVFLDFLEANSSLVDSDAWDKVLSKYCLTTRKPLSFLVKYLYELGFDPLPYMTRVLPTMYKNASLSFPKVLIPDSISLIGAYAYSGSDIAVLHSSNVNYISSNAFSRCKELEKAILPKVEGIAHNAFEGCVKLSKVEFSDYLTCIDDSAFAECESLEQINIPDSVTTIKDAAFYNCSKASYIHLGDGVTTLGDQVFSRCEGVKVLEIGNKISSMGKNVFYGCYPDEIRFNGNQEELDAFKKLVELSDGKYSGMTTTKYVLTRM